MVPSRVLCAASHNSVIHCAVGCSLTSALQMTILTSGCVRHCGKMRLPGTQSQRR